MQVDWLEILREQVEKFGTIQAVADQLGYDRSSISSALSGMRAATLATRAAANDNQFGALSRVEFSRGSSTQSNIQAQARRSASSSGGGTVINYAPTITIEGGSPDAEERFKEMLKQHSREVKKVVDDENNRVARRSYG